MSTTPPRHAGAGAPRPTPRSRTRTPSPLDIRTRLLVQSAGDLGASSRELAGACMDAQESRRLSPARTNLLRLLDIPTTATVLELGAGPGTVTRYLGETCGRVDAWEVDPELAAIARLRCAGLDGVRIFDGGVEELPPPTPGSGYQVVLVLPSGAGRPWRTSAQLADLLIRLTALLADDGVLVIAVEPGRAAGARTALAAAGCPTEQSLRALPDHVLTTAVFPEQDAGGATPHVDHVVDGLVGRPGTGSTVLIGRRHAARRGEDSVTPQVALPRIPLLFPDLVRTTEVDGVRLLAADITVTGPVRHPVLIRRSHHLGAPTGLRLNGDAREWRAGSRLVDELARAGTGPALSGVLQPWLALLAEADTTDGMPVSLVPRHLVKGTGPTATWLPVGADLRIDGWTREDLLAHGLLDSAMHLASRPEQVRRTAQALGAAANLRAGWLIPALERESVLLAARNGGDSEAIRATLEARLYGPDEQSWTGRRRALRAVGGAVVRRLRGAAGGARRRLGDLRR